MRAWWLIKKLLLTWQSKAGKHSNCSAAPIESNSIRVSLHTKWRAQWSPSPQHSAHIRARSIPTCSHSSHQQNTPQTLVWNNHCYFRDTERYTGNHAVCVHTHIHTTHVTNMHSIHYTPQTHTAYPTNTTLCTHHTYAHTIYHIYIHTTHPYTRCMTKHTQHTTHICTHNSHIQGEYALQTHPHVCTCTHTQPTVIPMHMHTTVNHCFKHYSHIHICQNVNHRSDIQKQ